MPYTPILATLGYVLDESGNKVLLVHRIGRGPDDPHHGKYNGLGGKLERDEDIVAGMKRELMEEAGINVEEMELAGTVSWPGFGKQGEDWFGFIFRITSFSGDVKTANDEGDLLWMNIDSLMDLQMWEGDRYFLPLVFAREPVPFHGVMPYANGKPTGWSVSSLA
jgi:8-oxo-dGTP diphosphatase